MEEEIPDELAAFVDELAREGFAETEEEQPPALGDRVLVMQNGEQSVRLVRLGGRWTAEVRVERGWRDVDELRAKHCDCEAPKPERGFAQLVDDTRELLERLRD